jgi:hypothetical protein
MLPFAVTATSSTPNLSVVPDESMVFAVGHDGPRKCHNIETIDINNITTVEGRCASTSHIVGVAGILLSLKSHSAPKQPDAVSGIASATRKGWVCEASSLTLCSSRIATLDGGVYPNVESVFIAPASREGCMVNQAAVNPSPKRTEFGERHAEAGWRKCMSKEPAKEPRTICCFDGGCPNKAMRAGMCFKHKRLMAKGAVNEPRKICCFEGGCPNKAMRGDMCNKHSGKMKIILCSVSGCPNKTVKNGVCVRHGAKKHKICSQRGCVNIVKEGGVCIRHGAQVRKCSHEGCNNNALKDGVCVRHGAQRATCGHEGCMNKVLKGGVCARHGATCSVEGCTNKVSTGNVCAKHFATIKTMIFRNENARQGKRKGVCIQDVAGMLNKLSRPPPLNITTL